MVLVIVVSVVVRDWNWGPCVLYHWATLLAPTTEFLMSQHGVTLNTCSEHRANALVQGPSPFLCPGCLHQLAKLETPCQYIVFKYVKYMESQDKLILSDSYQRIRGNICGIIIHVLIISAINYKTKRIAKDNILKSWYPSTVFKISVKHSSASKTIDLYPIHILEGNAKCYSIYKNVVLIPIHATDPKPRAPAVAAGKVRSIVSLKDWFAAGVGLTFCLMDRGFRS